MEYDLDKRLLFFEKDSFPKVASNLYRSRLKDTIIMSFQVLESLDFDQSIIRPIGAKNRI